MVFGSFSLAALFAESTKFLHLGGLMNFEICSFHTTRLSAGFLSSALLALFITSFFARYAAVQPLLLYGGLIVNSLFIVYDTQLIAEKRRRGDTDYIVHCMELFIDFVQVCSALCSFSWIFKMTICRCSDTFSFFSKIAVTATVVVAAIRSKIVELSSLQSNILICLVDIVCRHVCMCASL